MLANGATLEYKKKADTSGNFTKLKGLKEIPEIGIEPEKVENTTLEDTVKQYEMGIGDIGDIVYKFSYDNTSEDSSYRLMREAQTLGEVLTFKETLKDGTVTQFDGQVAVKRTGGGVNGVIDFNLNIALQSGLTITDPTPKA